MPTYREKIKEYEARVKKAIEMGLEPREKDLGKLYYYVGRAEKKGLDHPKTMKDRAHNIGKNIGRTASEILEETAKVLISKK